MMIIRFLLRNIFTCAPLPLSAPIFFPLFILWAYNPELNNNNNNYTCAIVLFLKTLEHYWGALLSPSKESSKNIIGRKKEGSWNFTAQNDVTERRLIRYWIPDTVVFKPVCGVIEEISYYYVLIKEDI